MSTMSLPLLGVLLLAPGAGAAPQPLERELLRVAPELVKEFQARGYNNVGVLKFLISKDGKTMSDHAGTLNLFLARRLEVALVLAQRERPVGIIDNATAVAHRTKGANHLTPAGRKRFFEAKYPLPWGDEEVTADAFVTGIAQVSQDLKTLEIGLFVFDRKSPDLKPILKDFTVRNLPEHLVELGESFGTRGLGDGGKVVLNEDKIVQAAAQAKDPKQTHPAADPKAAVTLEVHYNGKVVPLQVEAGKATIPEPQEGQKVELVLKRDNSREKYGVVLKVNGQSTIEKQHLPDLNCRRWILDPDDEPLTIKGYQVSDKDYEEFRVLSLPESRDNEIRYGADVGMITLTVYREQKGQAKPPDPSDEAKDAEVVGKGTLQTKPEKGEPEKPPTFGSLKARLLANSNRGLIGEGQVKPGAVQRVKFTPDPLPVMTLTVIYYRPQGAPKLPEGEAP